MKFLKILAAVLPGILLPTAALAAAPKFDSGDTAWMLTSSALVLMMTIPGLALFYGGMVRKKNVLATLAQSFGATCIITVLWMVIGYSHGLHQQCPTRASINSSAASTSSCWADGRECGEPAGPTIPESVYMFFQMTFAIITPALIAGALADRMKFSAFMWFMALWLLLVYCPIAHWVWGGGWLGTMGALDFAGGTVVHLNAGTAALVTCLMLGKRIGLEHRKHGAAQSGLERHRRVAVVGGLVRLQCRFRRRRQLNAGMAAAATQIATAAAALAWMFAEWIDRQEALRAGHDLGRGGGSWWRSPRLRALSIRWAR